MNLEENAACRNLPSVLFFEGYDTEAAYQVDKLCWEVCPVRKECLKLGIDNPGKIQNTGVFGGVYLTLGKFTPTKNKHKSEEQKTQINAEFKEIREEIANRTS